MNYFFMKINNFKIKPFDNDDELNKIKNYYLSKKIQILKPLKIIKFNILKI